MSQKNLFVCRLVIQLLVVSSALWLVASHTEDITVNTKYGWVVGLVQNFPQAVGPIKRIHKFLGIPYAMQPLDDRRFQPPQPLKPWKPKVHNARVFGNICLQQDMYLQYLRSSIKRIWPEFTDSNVGEDCLNLNIYAPERTDDESSNSTLNPVLFYIHGGTYHLGTPIRYKTPGDILPLYGIVLVTIHYRLGVMGFLTTGDSAAPGNYGMLDQIQALKWVKENIADFGGDPNKITISGNSAGGSSVGLHLLSPLTKGLFQRAIIESGVELSPFAILPLKTAVEKSKVVARNLFCDTENHQKMVECLRKKDASDLVYYYTPFAGPVVDDNFLPDTPDNLRKAGKFNRVPLILGFTKHDGYHMLQKLDLPPVINPWFFRKAIERALQTFLKVKDKHTAARLADALEFVYYPWGATADSQALREAVVSMCTDYFIIGPTMKSANFHAQFSPTYLYEYLHTSNLSKSRWVSHSTNVDYGFGAPLYNKSRNAYTDQDRDVSRFIMNIYSNFVKYGNPTPSPVNGVTWTAYSPARGAYMKIQLRPIIAFGFEPRRIALWNYYMPKIKALSCSGNSGTSRSNQVAGMERKSCGVYLLFFAMLYPFVNFVWC